MGYSPLNDHRHCQTTMTCWFPGKFHQKHADSLKKISLWGYPWRLMSGGRHEISVSQSFDMEDAKGREPFVEMRFASAHDYKTVSEEGILRSQRRVPAWVGRLHGGYARWVLDSVVQELAV